MRNYVTGKYQLHVRLTGRRKSSQNFWLNFEKKKKKLKLAFFRRLKL